MLCDLKTIQKYRVMKIERGKWYLCKDDTPAGASGTMWQKNNAYYAVDDNRLMGQSSVFGVSESQSANFRAARRSEIPVDIVIMRRAARKEA